MKWKSLAMVPPLKRLNKLLSAKTSFLLLGMKLKSMAGLSRLQLCKKKKLVESGVITGR